MRLFPVLFALLILIVVVATVCNSYLYEQTEAKIPRSRGEIKIEDPNLRYEVVASGLEFPTTVAFSGPNDILVNKKNSGTIQRIIDGKVQPQPLLDVNVANQNERGMLGIAVALITVTILPLPMSLYHSQKLKLMVVIVQNAFTVHQDSIR